MRYVPPKSRFLQEPHGVTSQKTASSRIRVAQSSYQWQLTFTKRAIFFEQLFNLPRKELCSAAWVNWSLKFLRDCKVNLASTITKGFITWAKQRFVSACLLPSDVMTAFQMRPLTRIQKEYSVIKSSGTLIIIDNAIELRVYRSYSSAVN
jgi:hypothetical protein